MPKLFHEIYPNGLYYKRFMIVNDNSRIINKLGALIIDAAKIIIYDCHMFIVQATGVDLIKTLLAKIYSNIFVRLVIFISLEQILPKIILTVPLHLPIFIILSL